MMLYPALDDLSAHIHNRYMLVNVVAKRARQIAEAYDKQHRILNEKPVTMAIMEVATGEFDDPEGQFEEEENEEEEYEDDEEDEEDDETDEEDDETDEEDEK